MTILASRAAPGLLDRYLAKAGHAGELTDERNSPGLPANLFRTVPGDYGSHGRFNPKAKKFSYHLIASEHPYAVGGILVGIAAALITAARRRS